MVSVYVATRVERELSSLLTMLSARPDVCRFSRDGGEMSLDYSVQSGLAIVAPSAFGACACVRP